jgi:hypothetical protein
MISREELRIRQLILNEYRSGSSIKQALVNINVGCVVIPRSKIEYWYKRFGSGNLCILDQDKEQYGITAATRNVVRNFKRNPYRYATPLDRLH